MLEWDHRLCPPPAGVTPARPGAADGPTRDQVRGKGWRRVSRGLYVPADTPDTASQRIVEVAARLPPYAVIGGWAAAYWAGVRFLDGVRYGVPTPVPVNLGTGTRHVRPFPGAGLMRARLADGDVTEVRGLRVTSPVRTAFDGARLAETLLEAVAFLDMALAAELVTSAEVTDYLREHRADWRGIGQAREALALADPRTRSPQETRLRLVWLRVATLPPPLVNWPIYDLNGVLLGVPDLLDPEAATVAEFDGDQHRDLRHHTADNEREERFEDHGLVVTRVTRLDLRHPDHVARRLRSARLRGLARDRSRDRWTLDRDCGPGT